MVDAGEVVHQRLGGLGLTGTPALGLKRSPQRHGLSNPVAPGHEDEPGIIEQPVQHVLEIGVREARQLAASSNQVIDMAPHQLAAPNPIRSAAVAQNSRPPAFRGLPGGALRSRVRKQLEQLGTEELPEVFLRLAGQG